MASVRKITAERQEPQGSGTRPLHKRALPFLGLFAAAPMALLTAWLMHAYIRGFDWTWRLWRWTVADVHLAGSETAWTITVILLTLCAVGLSYWAWHAGNSRKMALRVMLTFSVGAVVLDFGIQVGAGPGRWVSFFGVVFWWIVAAIWVLPRLDVTRRDSRGEEQQEDTLKKELGLEGYQFGGIKQYTLNGEVVRTDFEASHAGGGTIKPLQDAVPAIESLADAAGLGAPSGMSSVRLAGGASKFKGSIIHKDILEGGVPYELPYALQRGQEMTIEEPEIVGRYIDLEPAEEELQTTQGVIGMTGAGKTEYARVRITGMSTRTWVAPLLYFDKVKGLQSVAPVLGACGSAVLSNDQAPHRAGVMALKRAIQYRADKLGRLGHDKWEPGIIDPDTGEPMPKLIAWFEEADETLDGLEAIMKFIASKTRSTGIVAVWSLQRADHESMPTSVRANITSWSVFGISPADDYSATFALSDEVVKQGAQPFWGDTKPGYSYRTERGIKADRWPVVRRVFQGDREVYETITNQYGPRMMPLDSGTVKAMAGWYEQAKAERDALAAQLTAKGMASTVTADSTATAKAAPAFTPRTEEQEQAESDAALQQEIEDDIEEMRETGELRRNPEADEPGDSEPDIDKEFSPVAPEDDVEWGEIGGKPAARDRDAALTALYRTLQVLSQDPALQDPGDPTITRFQVHTILERFPFRSRPWFSMELAAISLGEQEIPAEYGLTLTEEEDDDDGHYVLHRVT